MSNALSDAVPAPNKLVSLMKEMNDVAARASAECPGDETAKYIAGYSAAITSGSYTELFMLVSDIPVTRKKTGQLVLLDAEATRTDPENPGSSDGVPGWDVKDASGKEASAWTGDKGVRRALEFVCLDLVVKKSLAGDYATYNNFNL